MIWPVFTNCKKSWLIWPLIILLINGCSHRKQNAAVPSEAVERTQRTEIEAAWLALHRGQHERAFLAFREFEKKNGPNPYLAEARIGAGRALIGLREYQQAIEQFREVINTQKTNQPRLAGLALFYCAAAYEAQGEYSMMKASLKDAAKLQDHLPPEVRDLLLPIKMSVAELMTEDIEAANKNIALAEQALLRFQLQEKDLKAVAELNLEIARALTPTPQEETFVPQIRYFQRSQPFFVRAIETEEQPWAEAALQALTQGYRDFFQLAENPKVNLTMDPRAVQRERRELTAHRLTLIDETRNRLVLLQKPSWSEPNRKTSTDLIEFLQQSEQRIEQGLRTAMQKDL